VTGFWTNGPIRTTVLRPYASDLVGLQTCWDRAGEKEGMRIWHAADSTTFREYSWYVGDGNVTGQATVALQALGVMVGVKTEGAMSHW
jgi:hypothetical protein